MRNVNIITRKGSEGDSKERTMDESPIGITRAYCQNWGIDKCHKTSPQEAIKKLPLLNACRNGASTQASQMRKRRRKQTQM